MFPIVTDLEQFKRSVGEKPEIKFMEQSNGTIVGCYLISNESTFDNVYALECRGIVFDKNGKVIARPLSKFFNVNQQPDTQLEVIDWSKVVRVMDKRDGSMIHTVKVVDDVKPAVPGARFTLKSKKSYESDVAVAARAFLAKGSKSSSGHERGYVELCNHVTDLGMTAIFEYTSPTARIVLPYAKDDLVLLHVRENVTGRYLTIAELKDLGDRFNVPGVASATLNDEGSATFDDILDAIKNDPKKLYELYETVENLEGWIFQFENGDMVKMKTKWYMDRHHLMTFVRERDIAEAVLHETLDDQKAFWVGEGIDISEIVEIENRVVRELNELIADITDMYEKVKHLDRKTIALTYGQDGENYPYFKHLMLKFSGKEPDYVGLYEDKFLKQNFSIRQLNLLQSVAEEE